MRLLSFSGVSVVMRVQTARRHIDKTGFIIDHSHINFHRVSGNRQFQRFVQRFRNTGAGGKIVSGAERQRPSAGGAPSRIWMSAVDASLMVPSPPPSPFQRPVYGLHQRNAARRAFPRLQT